MKYDNLLACFVTTSKEILSDNLVGIYLHGSLAMNCFNSKKSDLDLILVVEKDISDDVKRTFLEKVVQFNEEAPAKGIELSIVKREYCKPFVYPTPFELHFSIAHLQWWRENPQDYVEKMKGMDKDLAAHFTIMNHYGKVLCGEPIEKVFGEVPKADYIDSIWYDVENAVEEILENPMYMTLNLCRVLAYVQENLVLSKRTGGEWGLKKLSQEYHPIISEALRCYESDEEMKIYDAQALDFVEYMLAKIRDYIE